MIARENKQQAIKKIAMAKQIYEYVELMSPSSLNPITIAWRMASNLIMMKPLFLTREKPANSYTSAALTKCYHKLRERFQGN